MIIPELPAYLTSLGGADYKGLIIALFTFTAMISRPFSGKLADKVGRVPVMVFGPVVCVVCSAIYPWVSTVAAFLLLRLVHGFSTGFKPTGQTAFLSDIIPQERRGEAMGLLGTAGSLGMAGGPAIGGLVASSFGLDAMFYLSSFFGFLSIMILLGVKDTVDKKHSFSLDLLKIDARDLFEPLVLAPSIVMLLTAYAYGTVYTILPDFGEFVGISNKGVLFTFLTVASLLVRLIGGRASDRWGRKPVLIIATSAVVVGMVIIGTAVSKLQLIISITVYGFAQKAMSPTLLAWAADLCNVNHKGRGIATLYMAMEFGIGVGALTSGFIYGNDARNFLITFFTSGTLSVFAFMYLMVTRKKGITVSR